MPQLKVIRDTTIKRRPIQSADLPEDQRQELKVNNTTFELHSFSVERDHLRVAFSKETFKGFNTWYAFAEHVQIIEDGKVIYPPSRPASVRLPVTYKSQRDNEENPDGSCNVTSLAMAMNFLGAKRRSSDGQFEDELYRYTVSNSYSRHSPYDLAKVVSDYGLKDDFRANATIAQVQEWLAKGNPAVIHGYWTSFGHIVTVVGYDDKGLIVHDPYGEWNSWGYYRNALGAKDDKGAFVNYSYGLIRKVCIPDGSFWVHFISK